MQSLTTALLLALVLAYSAGVHSAEAEPEPTAAETESSESADAKQGTEGVFLPSEEISEDFAVSFPVDI